MKRTSSILWGIVLVAVGVIFALNALNIVRIDLFFDGWWTLFIIVPCAIGLFTEREKTGNILGIVIGTLLLLCCQEILSFAVLWKLLIPAVIVVIGLKLLLTGLFGNKANELKKQMKREGKEPRKGFAVFSGSDLNYAGEPFEGADLLAIFGGVECDLRNAIIEKDCAIHTTAIFGGIDVFVPENVNVQVNSNSLFGGVDNNSNQWKRIPNAPTVYVRAICLFGGVEIK